MGGWIPTSDMAELSTTMWGHSDSGSSSAVKPIFLWIHHYMKATRRQISPWATTTTLCLCYLQLETVYAQSKELYCFPLQKSNLKFMDKFFYIIFLEYLEKSLLQHVTKKDALSLQFSEESKGLFIVFFTSCAWLKKAQINTWTRRPSSWVWSLKAQNSAVWFSGFNQVEDTDKHTLEFQVGWLRPSCASRAPPITGQGRVI